MRKKVVGKVGVLSGIAGIVFGCYIIVKMTMQAHFAPEAWLIWLGVSWILVTCLYFTGARLGLDIIHPFTRDLVALIRGKSKRSTSTASDNEMKEATPESAEPICTVSGTNKAVATTSRN